MSTSTPDAYEHHLQQKPVPGLQEEATVTRNFVVVSPAPPEEPSLVPVDPSLLRQLQHLQEDLWDYVEAFMIANNLRARADKTLSDYLKQAKELADSDLYWKGVDASLGGNFLRVDLSENVLRLLGERATLVTDVDDALRRAREHVDTATNPFQGATRAELALEVLRCVERMRSAAADVASLCEARAKDLSVDVKRSVDRIFARMESPRGETPQQAERMPSQPKAPEGYVADATGAVADRFGPSPDPAIEPPDVEGHADPRTTRSLPT
jgi:hypothetical protein